MSGTQNFIQTDMDSLLWEVLLKLSRISSTGKPTRDEINQAIQVANENRSERLCYDGVVLPRAGSCKP